MNDNRTGGMLLVAGTAAALITMVFHPMPHPGGLPSPHEMAVLAFIDRLVHTLALIGLPMTFLGALVLTRRLAGAGTWPLAALVVFAFAAVAIMVAAAMSGFVGADIMSRMVEGDPKLESRRMMLDYTFRINQAFSSIYTVGSCGAIFLWSLTMLKSHLWPTGLAWYGLASAPVIALALLSGHLSLDVHGFGLVVLVQGIWFIATGLHMMRSTDSPGSRDESPAASART